MPGSSLALGTWLPPESPTGHGVHMVRHAREQATVEPLGPGLDVWPSAAAMVPVEVLLACGAGLWGTLPGAVSG